MKNYGFMVFGGFFLLLCSTLPAAVEKNFTEESPLLKHVPENTLFFSGNSQRVSAADYPMVKLDSLFVARFDQSFFYTLFADLEKSALAFYSIAEQPVLKVIVLDKQALPEILNKVEKNTGQRARQAHFKGQEYNFYPLGKGYQLIVLMQQQADDTGLVTLALMRNDTTAATKALIFGLTLPQQSVSRKVQKIQQENHYLPVSVNFLDIKKFVQVLYHNQQTLNHDMLPGELRSKACETDILRLLDDMPLLLGGYKNLQQQGQQTSLDFELLLALKNHSFKAELTQFRGFIPAYIRQGRQENILAVGLGVDFSQLSPFFIYLSQVLRDRHFQCAPLKAVQQDIIQLNPLSLAMMTGVVDGIQGVSFALQEFSLFAQKQPQDRLFELSAVISLTAEQPLKVWQMIAALSPQAAAYKPANSPTRLTIPQLDTLGIETFLALQGQHLVLYTGTEGERVSQQLAGQEIVKNGLWQNTFNYSKATQAVKDLRTLMTSESLQMNQPPLPAETCLYLDKTIAALSETSGWIAYQSDFIAPGWQHILSADIEFNAPASSWQLPGKYAVYSIQDGCELAIDGVEELLSDGTGFYQQYSQDRQCFIAEVRYRWTQNGRKMLLQYVSEHRRPEGLCSNDFSDWLVPDAEFINDSCILRKEPDSEFTCLYDWDGVLHKSVYRPQ